MNSKASKALIKMQREEAAAEFQSKNENEQCAIIQVIEDKIARGDFVYRRPEASYQSKAFTTGVLQRFFDSKSNEEQLNFFWCTKCRNVKFFNIMNGTFALNNHLKKHERAALELHSRALPKDEPSNVEPTQLSKSASTPKNTSIASTPSAEGTSSAFTIERRELAVVLSQMTEIGSKLGYLTPEAIEKLLPSYWYVFSTCMIHPSIHHTNTMLTASIRHFSFVEFYPQVQRLDAKRKKGSRTFIQTVSDKGACHYYPGRYGQRSVNIQSILPSNHSFIQSSFIHPKTNKTNNLISTQDERRCLRQ